MELLLALLFLALAAAAALFACWPVVARRGEAGSRILAAAVALLVLAIGCGVYLMVGTPALALRTLAGPADGDWKGLIGRLVVNARAHPSDETAWVMLGRGYLLIDDGTDGAAAFQRAIALAAPAQRPALFGVEGEALMLAAQGEVTPEAEAAFALALRGNPKDPAARYYLGFAYASRRDTVRALALWDGLLADTPPNAPWRAALIDRIAALKASTGQAPDIAAMVAGLAARLRANPNDPDGWQRLVRAYAVLGDAAKAHTALGDARAALKDNSVAMAALSGEAKELKLEK
jgi:cytochrome c-type biogenesis protein CcmH